jgi:NTP pyrophosphatase (non-canonical NTP hydrolase)
MSQDFATLTAKAVQVRDHYNELQEQDGQKRWSASERMSGFVGDVGMLSKLIMAKQGLRRGPDNLDSELAHEMADCLWSIIVIADELGIDLEAEYLKVMDELHARIERQKADSSKLR